MNGIQICLLMLCCWFVVGTNAASIWRDESEEKAKLTKFVNDIKLYLKKLYELHKQFPEEFIKGKDKIDEIEKEARKIVEAINQIRNAWNVEDYEKNMAIICGMSQNDESKTRDME